MRATLEEEVLEGSGRRGELEETQRDQPGALRSETWLTLETRQAQRLVQGRRAEDGKAEIIGLKRFAAMLRSIWAGARTDDPYGDWWLIRIEDALESSHGTLKALEHSVQERLRERPAIEVAVAHSIEPVRIPLLFTSPHAFRGAYLIADVDRVIRAILTARHVGLMNRDESERLIQNEAGRAVRRALGTARGYRYKGINRDDLRQLTARGCEARDTMGEVPEAILAGTLRPRFGPVTAPTGGGFGRGRLKFRNTPGSQGE
jgi:integrating conjugative element protein (TIGR03761 family)